MGIKKNNIKCVGVVCGSGNYPKLVVQSCIEKEIDFCLIFLNGVSSPTEFALGLDGNTLKLQDNWISINFGEIGKVIDFFRRHNVDKVIFAGAVKRPNFKELSLDAKGASWLLKLGKSIFSGDDVLLRSIAELVENEGFSVISGSDLVGDIFVRSGALSHARPTELEYLDIKKGFEAAKTLGNLDIGQSVVAHNGLILGVECTEGTDELIDRCAKLRELDRGGVLIKASKPSQDHRLDLPTIGADTIHRLHAYNFSGVAIEAEKCIVINKKLVIEQINDFSMFFVGIK